MARIPMTSGFSLIPEGEYVFLIHAAEYDPDFGKMAIHLITADGQKYDEKYNLKNADDTMNDKALGAFSYFAKTAMNDFSMQDIDEQELVGHYIKCEIIHRKSPSKNDPTKTVTFVNTGNKSVATGFDKEPIASVKALMKTPVAPASDLNLDALLG